MTDEEFDQAVNDAKKRVESMDAVDRWRDRELRTILFALEAGLKCPETGAAFDAYFMLKELCDP